MAIYFMNSKTFFKTFLEEDPDIILNCQYVIISQSIRRTQVDDQDILKRIINGTTVLYPSDGALCQFNYSDHHDEFNATYMEQLDRVGKGLIAALVKSVIDEDYTIILLCTKNDTRFGFMELIRYWTWENLKFPIYDYKKIKNGKAGMIPYDRKKVSDKCDKILKKSKKEDYHKKTMTQTGRKRLLADMTKKERKKLLKKMGLYSSTMTDNEIAELLVEFFVGE